MFRGLTPQQQALQVKHMLRKRPGLARPLGPSPRRALKWCNRCGGKHRGYCEVMLTTKGTFARADIVPIIEAEMRPKPAVDLRFTEGAQWQSKDPRDKGRKVEILEHYEVGDRFRVKNAETGRRTTVKRETLVGDYEPVT